VYSLSDLLNLGPNSLKGNINRRVILFQLSLLQRIDQSSLFFRFTYDRLNINGDTGVGGTVIHVLYLLSKLNFYLLSDLTVI
jgi:hypothetical protein